MDSRKVSTSEKICNQRWKKYDIMFGKIKLPTPARTSCKLRKKYVVDFGKNPFSTSKKSGFNSRKKYPIDSRRNMVSTTKKKKDFMFSGKKNRFQLPKKYAINSGEI